MTLLFANNAVSLLAVTANLSDTALSLTPASGALFPSPGVGESFLLTIQDATQYEIVECTARSVDTLTVVRAREGTAAQTWSLGSSVSMRTTAGTMTALEQRARAQADYAPINGPIILTADPAAGTHAVRESYLAARESTIRADLGADIVARGRYVGEVIDFSGPRAPSRTVWAAGQALSRATYSELFEALTSLAEMTTVAGSPVVTITGGVTDGAAAGVPISALTYFTAGTTIVSVGAGTLTLSTNALFSATGQDLRICPHGVGDSSTTFNAPDRRGRIGVGRDDMNASAAGRVTAGLSGISGVRLGAAGGDERLHAHGHGVNDPGHGHSVNDPGHDHTVPGNVAFANQSTLFLYPLTTGGGNYIGFGSPVTTASNTGISINANGTGISIQTSGAGASQNVQPSQITNYVIFTNVP